MAFSESLTVRILGDSSGLQRELDSVLHRFDELKTKISETANSTRQFSSSFGQLTYAIGPLQHVSNLIAKIGQQLQSISQRPIALNVAPALQSLQQLTLAALQAAAAIQAIPNLPAMGPAGLPGTLPVTGVGQNQPPRRLAGGGLVAGRSGIDRVPAQLTAGEFVLNRSAVASLGLGFLEQLNSISSGGGPNVAVAGTGSAFATGGPTHLESRGTQPLPSLQIQASLIGSGAGQRDSVNPLRSHESSGNVSHQSQTNNHFGGITIQVTEQAETESLLRNLELQGIGRRIRQG